MAMAKVTANYFSYPIWKTDRIGGANYIEFVAKKSDPIIIRTAIISAASEFNNGRNVIIHFAGFSLCFGRKENYRLPKSREKDDKSSDYKNKMQRDGDGEEEKLTHNG